MRTSIVPAQITTVEDRIAGNITLTQMFLLVTPVFIGSTIYLLFPPQFHFAMYKLAIIASMLLICCILAIRIQGKVVIHWLVILLRYATRPRYYVADKNTMYQRNTPAASTVHIPVPSRNTKKQAATMSVYPPLSLADRMTVEQLLPRTTMRFLFGKKGGMRLVLTQSKP